MADTEYAAEDRTEGIEESNDDDALLKEGKKRLEAAWEYDKHNREEALKDLRFLALDQWPEQIRNERQAANRPALTLDHLNQTKNQVVNDIRQAKIGMKAIPGDDDADVGISEIYTSLMRDVQYQSHADHIFAMAADNAVGCGIGHFRYDTRYVKDRVFEQELIIKLIPYALAVYWDPAAIEPDRSDADWCFVTEFVPTETFETRFPKAKKVDFETAQKDDSSNGLYWASANGVLLAEYWRRKPEKKRLCAFENGAVYDCTGQKDDEIAALQQKNGKIIGERDADGYKIEQCLMSGAEILMGPREWAGQYIPIIPVIGTETFLDNKVIRKSLIRGARDPQQLYNYWRSAAAELIALAPKSKWLVTPKQIASHRAEWEQAHSSPKAYLTYTPDPSAPTVRPERVDPPEAPAAIWQEARLVVDDMKAATGIYDASLGAKSNETSGVAIERRQQEGDVSTYHFSDNLRRSLEHAGRIMIDLIPKIYDTSRAIRVMGDNDAQKFEKINWPIVNEYGATATDEQGNPLMHNDLTQGRYDVRVSIGPSYTTKRIEARQTLVEYCKADPAALPIVRDIIARNLDFEGAEEMAERFKKSVDPKFLPEDQQVPPLPPNPQEEAAKELLLKEKGAKTAKLEGEARRAHAQADQQEIENQIIETQTGISPPEQVPPPSWPPPGGQPSSGLEPAPAPR